MSRLDCDTVLDLLPERAAGRLDEDTAAAVERHLETCAECRAEAELVRRIAERTVSPPADLQARVVAAVKARPAPDAGRGGAAAPDSGAATSGAATSAPESAREINGARAHARRVWWGLGRPLAIAASVMVLLAVGAGLWLGLRRGAGPSLQRSLAAVDALPVATGAQPALAELPADDVMVAGAATLDGLNERQLRTLLSEMGS